MEYPYQDEVSGKRYRYRYLSEDTRDIRIGEFEEHDGLTVPITVVMFGDEKLQTMKKLQQLSMNNTCFMFPDWVESGMAIYKRIVNVWDPKMVTFSVVQLNQVLAVTEDDDKIRVIVSTTDATNYIIQEILAFVLRLHEKRIVLDRFCSTDFVTLEGDNIPKLWTTAVLIPPQNEFEEFRRQNLIDLAEFFTGFLSPHISNLYDYTESDLPSYTKEFIRQLKEGRIGLLNCHVQVLGSTKSVLAFKNVIDTTQRLHSSMEISQEWTSIKDHFESIYGFRDGKVVWKEMSYDKMDSYWHLVMNYRTNGDTIDEFFNCTRNLITHLTDYLKINADEMFFVIEDIYPNMLSDFLNKVQEYPYLYEDTMAMWSINKM